MIRKLLHSVACLVLLFAAASPAWAACSRYPGFQTRHVGMDMGQIVIANDLPVGGRIALRDFVIHSGPDTPQFNCPGGGYAEGRMLQGTPVPGYDSVFTTAVPGVGIRLQRWIENGVAPYYPHLLHIPVLGLMRSGTYFRVELIKTAAITGNGPFASGTYTVYGAQGTADYTIITYLGGNGITIVTPSCAVDAGSQNITVAFGQVARRDFQGVGSAAARRDFNIRLNCRAGVNAEKTVNLRFDGVQHPSNLTGTLQLTPNASAATGVGIQLLDGAQAPVALGQDLPVGDAKDGEYVVPMSGRYVQTAGTITPGRADGTATFTVVYK